MKAITKCAMTSAVLAPLLLAIPAGAQTMATPSVGLPQTLVIPTRPGDAATDSKGLPLDIGMLPLRLSLSSGYWPHGATLPDCEEKSEQNGNTLHFMPLRRAAAIHLVPSLTLVGFSTTTCPIDATAGVGLVYTAPIRKDVWLVASAGASLLPTTSPTPSQRMRTDARLDIVWKPDATTHAFTFGVGRRGVTFGGAF